MINIAFSTSDPSLVYFLLCHCIAQWGPRRTLSSLFILQVKLSSLMPNSPARCQILNSERKSLKSFITEEREAFKVEFQICQLLFEWKSLLIKTYFLTYFLWNILQLLFWFIGICPQCIAKWRNILKYIIKLRTSKYYFLPWELTNLPSFLENLQIFLPSLRTYKSSFLPLELPDIPFFLKNFQFFLPSLRTSNSWLLS